MSSQESQYVPLSLRRKIVIALDPELLMVPPVTDASEAAAEAAANRFLSFKTIAWAKANIIRPNEDHVFLVTSLEPTGSGIDATVISTMWNSLFSEQDPHVDRNKVAESALRKLASDLNRVGVSVSTEVLFGVLGDKVPEYVHDHRGEILVVQAPERTALASTLAYSWAETCAQKSECPTIIVKKTDLPDNIAVALDPPLPTKTSTVDAAE
ncbi:hypothetical protein GGI07_005500 [Coemansia sp. Benny D115]|nr:hypothetical protein GGI07_005500 [Coemansia sp. Benny D115]